MIKASGSALTTGVSHLTWVVPVLRRKLPPQQQQAQEGAEAQHQEQSDHQGNPSYRTKKIRRLPWADRKPHPQASQGPRTLGAAYVCAAAGQCGRSPAPRWAGVPPFAQLQTAFGPPGPHLSPRRSPP